MKTKLIKLFSGDWGKFSIGLGMTLGIIAIVTGAGYLLAVDRAEKWGQNLRYFTNLTREENEETLNQTNSPDLDSYLQAFEGSTEQEKLRLKQQLEVIHSRTITHLRATKDFYIWSTLVPAISLLSSVITASCLLHITRKGWEKSDPVVTGIFVAGFASLAFSSSCILLYQYEENSSNNAALYVFYTNLEDDITTTLATRSRFSSLITNSALASSLEELESEEGNNADIPVTLKSIILIVQEELNKSHTLNIEIDLEQDFNVRELLEKSGLEQ